MPIVVPTAGQPILQTWGSSVADELNNPKRFSLWRTTNQTLSVDGASQVIFEGKDDPYAMCDTASSFKAPKDGLVLFSVCLLISVTGSSGNWYSYGRLTDVSGNELKRFGTGNYTAPAMLSSSVSGAFLYKVTANTVYRVYAVVSAAGLTKAITGGQLLTYWDGTYLSS